MSPQKSSGRRQRCQAGSRRCGPPLAGDVDHLKAASQQFDCITATHALDKAGDGLGGGGVDGSCMSLQLDQSTDVIAMVVGY